MEPEALTQLFTQQVDEAVGKRMSAVAESAPARLEGLLRENFPGLIQHMDVPAVAQFLARTFLAPLFGPLEEFRVPFEGEDAPKSKAAADHTPARIEPRTSIVLRPKVCVAPGCKETDGVGPRTGFTCPKHQRASKETKAGWTTAFIEQERKRHGLPPSRRSRKRESTTWIRAADDDAKILAFVTSQGKKGASNAELIKATGLSIARLHQRTWRLRQKERLISKGATTKARHYLPKFA